MESIYTIGHSTRTIEEFLALQREHGIRRLIDVRRYPGSRRYPHFGKEELPGHLTAAGIEYVHMEILGGRRTPRPDSPNGFWRNAQFRGYADHMDSSEFRKALDVLKDAAAAGVRQAIMCAEAVPWRCHRQLIADALVAEGIEVRHIIQPGKAEAHVLNASARISANRHLVYPATPAQMDLL